MNNDNFFSIDRLVEFGLGIAVAQQMANTMNHAIQNTMIPGAQFPMQPSRLPSGFYAVLDGKQAGPFSEAELVRLISENKITKSTYLWQPGMMKWDHAENIPDLLRIVALSPPPIPNIGDPSQ